MTHCYHFWRVGLDEGTKSALIKILVDAFRYSIRTIVPMRTLESKNLPALQLSLSLLTNFSPVL